MARKRKTALPTDVLSEAPMRVPKHGAGRLRSGGINPGCGAPPSELRARLRGSLAQRLEIAEQFADDPKASPADRMRALEFLAKYGLGTTTTQTDTQGKDVARPGRLAPDERARMLQDFLADQRN